jgi:hypothetical protein
MVTPSLAEGRAVKKTTDLKKLVKQARKALGFNDEGQQELLRRARKELDLTNEELANLLDISLPTLMAYLATESAAKHRRMKEADKLLLREILSQQKRKS